MASPSAARADDDAGPALGLVSAGAIEVAGVIVGGTLIARGDGDHFRDNAGWLTIESGFVLAPLAAHAASGEWGRGALFALVPLATLGVTEGIFQLRPDTVENGTLPQQRWMWAMFGTGLFASAVGVADSLWAPARAHKVVVAPAIGQRQVGLQIGGTL